MFEIFWVVLLILVIFTYRIKNPYLFWSCIIFPPLGLLLLIWMPIDIGSTPFWAPAIVAFVFSVCSIVFKTIWVLIRKMRNKPPILPSLSIRIIRPIMVIIIFPGVFYIVKLSLESADTYAVKVAKDVQEICDSNGACPEFIKGWKVDDRKRCVCETMYGKYGTKYPIRYNVEGNDFRVWVRHNIDEAFSVSGGVDKILEAELHIEGKRIMVDTNSLVPKPLKNGSS